MENKSVESGVQLPYPEVLGRALAGFGKHPSLGAEIPQRSSRGSLPFLVALCIRDFSSSPSSAVGLEHTRARQRVTLAILVFREAALPK